MLSDRRNLLKLNEIRFKFSNFTRCFIYGPVLRYDWHESLFSSKNISAINDFLDKMCGLHLMHIFGTIYLPYSVS